MDSKPVRYRDIDGAFEVTLPPGWEAERDGEGGLLIHIESGHGLLHLMPFQRDSADDLDPADELYAFLAEQEIELEEDEVADFDLPGGGALALCEYVAEEDEEEVFWIVGVANGPGQLIFASYSCPVGEQEREAETIRGILTTLTFF